MRHVLFRIFRDPDSEDWSRIYVAFMDMTDERRMGDQAARLHTAIEQTRDSILITDAEGRIEYCNPAFEQVTGYALEDVVGRTPRVTKSGRHDDAFYRRIWETITSGASWHGRFVNRRRNGELFTEDGSISPIFDAAGTLTNFVSVKRDVTRELELERQLTHAQKMEAIGQLAGGVAHDFNNILHAMLGNVEFALADDADRDDVHREVAMIRRNIERAASLTRQLLAFGRRQVLRLEPVEPNDLVAQLLRMVRRVIGEDIALDFRPGAVDCRVRIDPGQIEQVLLNLCLNARDAMPDGGDLRIETSCRELDADFLAAHDWAFPGSFVSIAVADTGQGIPAAVLPRIFEPFFTTKERGRGTGLGLATVYGTIKQHGGLILVDSAQDAGTTFTLLLPAVAGGEAQAEPEPAPGARAVGGDETILLAEDDETVRLIITRVLDRAGYEVLAAADGAEALQIFATHGDRIDLALLDLVMPQRSGPEVADAIRARRPAVKIPFNTGYSEDAIRRRNGTLADAPILMKPHDPADLLARIRAILDERTPT